MMDRNRGLGGTDIAAVAGVHPYRTAMDVWLQKTGQAEPFEPNEAMEWGNRLEDVVAQRWREGHPDVLVMENPGMLEGPEAWIYGSPDRLIVGADAGLEVKTAGFRSAHRWGEVGDQVPVEYLIQCHWYMCVTGRKLWHLAVLIGGQEYREFQLQRDPELEDHLVSIGRDFWLNNVVPKVPPPIDGSKSSKNYLDRRYSSTSGEMPVAVDTSLLQQLNHMTRLRALKSAVQDELDLVENLIKNEIADNDGLVWPGGKVHWKIRRGRAITDWKSVAAECSVPPEIIEKHTRRARESRPFDPKFKPSVLEEIKDDLSRLIKTGSGDHPELLAGEAPQPALAGEGGLSV